MRNAFVVYSVLLLVSICQIKFAISQSLADTLKLESVIIIHQRPLKGDLPGAKIISIDSLAIASKINQNLADLLLENSPLFIKTYGRGSFATVSMRGTGASHTQVYWNGLNINSPLSGEVDFSTIPIYFTDDINIHYGSSSMAFGSGGLGGAVNLESNIEWTDNFRVKLFQTVGSFNTYSSAIKASYGLENKIKLQTRVFYESSENNFTYRNVADFSRTNPYEKLKNADYQKRGLLQELHIKSKNNNIISAKFWLNDIDRSIPKLMINYSADEKNRQVDNLVNGVFQWNHFSDNTNLEVISGFSLQNLSYYLIKFPSNATPQRIVDSKNNSSLFAGKVKFEHSINRWLNFIIGADANFSDVNTRDRITTFGYNKQRTDLSFLTNIQIKPFRELTLNALIRKDFSDNTYSPVLPSFAGELRPFKDVNLIIKSSVSKNYHKPSLNHLYWVPGGNPGLKPEESLSFETGLKLGFKGSFISSNVELSTFKSNVENWILWLPSFKGYWESQNIDLVKNWGYEASIQSNKNLNKVDLIFNCSYSFTRTIHNGKQLPFIPIHSAVASSTIKYQKFYVTHNFTYFSKRYTTTSNNPNLERGLTPYFMNAISIGISKSVWKTDLHLLLRIDNLLNESYQSILWRPMPGRNYTLNLRIDL